MDNLRQLLVAIAALTLVFSIVSGANPNYFAGYVAHADDDEDEEEDNSRSSNYEEEDRDDSARHDKDDDDDDEHNVSATFGSSSKVELEIDDEIEDDQGHARAVEADLEIETEDEDLENGEHDVSLTCDSPDFEKEFDEPLKVDDGKGKFEQLLAFVNGTTYEDCVVAIGDTDVELPIFTVIVTEEEDDIDDEESGMDDDKDDDDHKRGSHERETELEIEDGEVEIEVKVETRLADGTYDAQLTCEEPDIDMTLEDSFKVEDGVGKLEAEFELAQGLYKGCELESESVVIASFDSFAIRQGQEDDDDDDDDDRSVEEKRKEKRKEIISKIRAIDEHKKRVNANPASPGDYRPGWNYTLTASGTGTPRGDVDIDALLEGSVTADAIMEEADVEVEMDMGVWKSNRALVLMSILDGTVQVDDKTYSVELGFGLYSVSHDAMRLAAFVSDEDGNIYKLKLRGMADDGSGFPTESGDSIDMVFEGNSGPARNSFDHWHLELEGTVEAE